MTKKQIAGLCGKTSNSIGISIGISIADRELLLDVLQLDERQFWG
ncbi:hypothetical protein QT971_02050 [Microcoleus sp. herbarium19]